MDSIEKFDFITSVYCVEVGKDGQRLSGRGNRSSIQSILSQDDCSCEQICLNPSLEVFLMSVRLYVGNLPKEEVNRDELHAVFERLAVELLDDLIG